MKKLLKKSFADFVEEYDKNPLDEKVILTGNLYKDLDEYFVSMIYSGMFYVPKGYAFKVELVKDYFSFHLQIELLKKSSAPIMTCAECVGVYENGRIHEYSCGDENIEMKRFILPMRELVKQMQQYYIDHNLVEKK